MYRFLIAQTTAAAALAVGIYALVAARENRPQRIERVELVGASGNRVVLDGDGITLRRDGDDRRLTIELRGLTISGRDAETTLTAHELGIAVLGAHDDTSAALRPGELRLDGRGGHIVADTTHEDSLIGATVRQRAATGDGQTRVMLHAGQTSAQVITSWLPAGGGDLSATMGVFDHGASVAASAGGNRKALEVR